MSSVQKKKGATEEDRQTILKQMKVRTKLKTDKSWIHQNSEDERDDIPSPVSPQLKALEGRKLLWSPTPESEPDRNSGIFTAKEVFTSSSSPPVKSSNKQFSYSSTETNTSTSTTSKPSPPPSTTYTTQPTYTTSNPSPPPSTTGNKQYSYSSTETNTSTTSKPSPPPSTTGNKPTNSYIIRGQPVNAVSQVKSPPSFNGYQKSQIQARTTSLPRVPTATGYKMSTEEYKKLAPYNISNKSSDLSDEETFTQQEQVKRTEQASNMLKNTTSKDRSYVISAAKRQSGSPTDSGPPFMAHRVEIQEETSPNRKSQTLPKTLSSYLAEDANRYDNKWTETQPKQTPPQSSPTRVTERSSSPRLTSYSMTSNTEGRSSPVKPEAGKITVVREENRNENKDVSKPSTEKTSTTTMHSTRTERVTERSSSPRMTSYSMTSNTEGRSSPVKPEAGKITVVREEKADNRNKKDETLPKSLDSYLYEDATRFEKYFKANPTVQPTLQTSPARVEVKDNKEGTLSKSLDSYLYEDATRFENNWKTNQPTQPTLQTSPARASNRPESPKLTSWNTDTRNSTIRPEPGKISVLREESNKPTENRSSSRTVNTRVESVNINTDIPKLTSYSDATETRSSNIQAGPGKLTVLKDESPDIPILTSSSLSRTLTENATPIMQVGPGKITVIREDSTPPKPVPRRETKPRDTSSDKQPDLIDWTDLDNKTDNRGKLSDETPLTVISPELNNKRPTESSRPGAYSTETRYKVSESLDDPESAPSSNRVISNSENRNVRISIETLSEQPTRTETFETERSSPPRITSNSGNRNVRISVETLSEQPTTTETFETERSSSPRVTSSSGNRNVRISVETLSDQPQATERSSSPRPSPRSRESTTTSTVTESRYRVPETLEDTMLESSPSRYNSFCYSYSSKCGEFLSNVGTTVTTTRSTDPVYTEYLEDRDSRSTRTVSTSREKITTTTVQTRYDNNYSADTSLYDPQSSSNKGVLFVKEYVNTSENLKSPTTAGSLPDFSRDSDMISYNSSSSYLYSSAPRRSDEGPCTYCGREIKDCAKIMLDHLNIYCHEYCFKCGICNKPMGDLIDSLFIHRDVVHCGSCYEKLF
ncbi:uncharacterized protein [Pyxicephalus adspersus]|uniref:uncharacterized protein n=1 Tax=Pyxicephalus adspersus TaxID=30357 RepID=UPI003B5CE4F9